MTSWLCIRGRRNSSEEPPQQPVNLEHIAKDEEKRNNVQRFFSAIREGNRADIKRLVERGCPVKDFKDEHKRTAFHVLTADCNLARDVLEEMFNIFITAGCCVDTTDQFGNTALKLAAEMGNIPILELLLKNLAKTEIEDKSKKDTALHWAAKNGKVVAIKKLLMHGAKINAQNKDRKTPLHLAVEKKEKDAVCCLILYFADKDLKDHNGLTPVDIAKRENQEQIVYLLEKLLLQQQVPATSTGQGEHVEADSGLDVVPMISLEPSTHVTYNYNIKVTGGINAIGQNAVVNQISDNRSIEAPLPALPSNPSAPPIEEAPLATLPSNPLAPPIEETPLPALPSAPLIEDNDINSS